MNTPAGADLSLLMQAEEERRTAAIKGDIEALQRLLADDVVYTHSSATVDNKEQYLGALRDGHLRYLEAESRDVNVRLYGNVAIMNGHTIMRIEVDGKEKNLNNLFQSVWVEREGHWQMASWASTVIPPKAA